jgi:hypothetical protein
MMAKVRPIAQSSTRTLHPLSLLAKAALASEAVPFEAAPMLRARRPTTVLFDDFHGRRHYVAVKRLAQKEARVGRMARFTVTPGPIPPDMLTEVNGWFADPR